MLNPPQTVQDVLQGFDSRTSTFTARDVELAIQGAMKDARSMTSEERRAGWVESAAFGFQTREVVDGGPWGTHFQPWMSGTNAEGVPFFVPDLREAGAESVEYWGGRAKTVKHPVLAARYADLVWDTTKFVTGGKAAIDFARIAIDQYIAAARLDDGSAWGETHRGLGRALELAISIKDAARTDAAVVAHIEYVDRTGDDDKIGTYCYLFERLLPGEKGPELSGEQERLLVEKFETKFRAMVTPESKWNASPHGPQSVGNLLAAYYRRKGHEEDRTRILRGVAETFERRAKISDALAGIMFLDTARRTYHDAGLRGEAERVQREAQALGPEAAKCMSPITAETEVKKEDVEKYLAEMTKGGLEAAMERFAVHFVPRQSEIVKWLEEKDKHYVAHKLFPTTKLAHGQIVAHVGDETGDPDGKMVHETAEHMQYSAPWISSTLDRMIGEGFTAAHAMDFIHRTPTFEMGRLRLVERGVEAHLRGDYVQAVHLLVPQIEHAIRTMVYLTGKPSNKSHRTGRGVMQFKNLNDLLAKDEWPVPGEGGEDLRMYLLATLAHPKGANTRNDVAHGLWPEKAFNRRASERVLHVLFAVAMVRLVSDEKLDDKDGTTSPPKDAPPIGETPVP